MKSRNSKLKRLVNGLTAAAFTVGVAVPALMLNGTAAAAGVLTSNSIEMSSSKPGATGVTYKVTFTPATSEGTTGEVIVDFCSNSPLEGSSCTATAGTDTPDMTNVGGPTTTAAVSDGTTKHTVKITGQTLTSGTAYTATLTNITNPSAVGTFYARIFTYASGGAASYVPKASGVPTEGSYADYAGVALSTANVIQISATVEPAITFCVSGLNPGPGCGTTGQAVTSPNVTLGHGTNNVLDATAVDVASVYSQLSTNAVNGAVVNGTISTGACGGLEDPSTDCIPPIGTLTVPTAGTADFGLAVLNGTGGSGTVSADANYHTSGENTCVDTNHFALNKANMTGTYGDEVASSTGAVNNVSNQYCFAATASNTTPAGVYTADMDLIATGTF